MVALPGPYTLRQMFDDHNDRGDFYLRNIFALAIFC